MNSRLQDGFIEDFLNSQDGRSAPKCSHHVRLRTRQEKRVEATQNLFDVSSKMKHVISELNHIYTVFSSNKPLSHRDIKSSCYIIKIAMKKLKKSIPQTIINFKITLRSH